uniref:Uncharacterized protein n=1 Tax=Caulobacter phage BL57 TaxID=3348355 RepID=A0AB74UMZ6_9VIRU
MTIASRFHHDMKSREVLIPNDHIQGAPDTLRGTCLAVVQGTTYYLAIVEVEHEGVVHVVDLDARRVKVDPALSPRAFSLLMSLRIMEPGSRVNVFFDNPDWEAAEALEKKGLVKLVSQAKSPNGPKTYILTDAGAAYTV